MESKYAHILYMPHPISATRPRMSLSRRAAQFAPFAALTGYEAIIAETARHTEAAITLDENEIASIDRCLQTIRADIAHCPMVRLRFFRPDPRKSGGSVEIYHGRVVKIDEQTQKMTLQSGEVVQFRQIIRLTRKELF